MWTIVCFEEENCVEVVPNYWFKNGCCAWPKKSIKNPKKYVVRRTEPNEVEFDYFKGRPISQNIASLHDARARLIMAQETSELSTYEEDKSTPISSNEGNNDDSSYDDSDLDKSYIPEKNSKHLNAGQTNYQSLGCPPSKVKRTLFEKFNNSIEESECLSSPINRNKKSSVTKNLSQFQDKPSILVDNDILEAKSSENSYKTSAIYNTSASPFKVSSPENHQIFTPTILWKQSLQKTHIKHQLYIIHLQSASPFKVSSPENHQIFTPTVPKEILAFSAAGNKNLLKKILGVVLKIRYDVEAVAQRQNELEKIMLNQNQWKDGQTLFEDQVDEFEFCVPITNEASLNDFEQKLATSQSFKSNVVNGLRRLSRKTLASTVRQMLHAVRKIKEFINCTNTEIESPIKIYIAGAAFRKKK
ncbi:DUF4806 domain-containing protein [Aphis craccivora]|uniref:DUF4806 domain-containing protein n=1 Tax=Aphis craccivora TaxID=307492 RepID=A0A6G0Y3Z6_APHCR|nr:DUF4806 domain-containing protein [Aphis craccivora]